MNIRARLAKLEREFDDSGDEFAHLTEDEVREELRKMNFESAVKISKKIGIPAEEITWQHAIDYYGDDVPGELAGYWRENIMRGEVYLISMASEHQSFATQLTDGASRA